MLSLLGPVYSSSAIREHIRRDAPRRGNFDNAIDHIVVWVRLKLDEGKRDMDKLPGLVTGQRFYDNGPWVKIHLSQQSPEITRVGCENYPVVFEGTRDDCVVAGS